MGNAEVSTHLSGVVGDDNNVVGGAFALMVLMLDIAE